MHEKFVGPNKFYWRLRFWISNTQLDPVSRTLYASETVLLNEWGGTQGRILYQNHALRHTYSSWGFVFSTYLPPSQLRFISHRLVYSLASDSCRIGISTREIARGLFSCPRHVVPSPVGRVGHAVHEVSGRCRLNKIKEVFCILVIRNFLIYKHGLKKLMRIKDLILN